MLHKVFLWWFLWSGVILIFCGKTSCGIAKCWLFSQVRVWPTDFRTETPKFFITVYNTSPKTHFIVWQIVTQSLISGLGWSVAGLRNRSGELRLHTLFLGQAGAPRGKETNYYSFKIFCLFWLAKIPCIIHHKQLLSTKFGRILWYWTDDINCAAINEQVIQPLTKKAWQRVWFVLVVSTNWGNILLVSWRTIV